MTPKKHPLEIFRKHGPFDSQPSKAPQSTRKSSSSTSSGSSGKGLTSFLTGGGGKAKGSSGTPGEWRLTMSLNTVLMCGLMVVVGCLGMYFLGYYKVLEKGPEPQLMDIWPDQGETAKNDPSIGKNGSQPLEEEENKPAPIPMQKTVYGIQVGTWAQERYDTAKEANSWLKKNGFDSGLYPLANKNEFIIIVGSFLKRDDPELSVLCQNLRSIDNYPYGDTSPFKDSRIRSYQIE